MSKTDIATLRNARWEHLEQEVVFRIRLLKGIAEKLEPTPYNDAIAQDLILPAMGLLAEFCQSVAISEEEEEDVMA